MTEAEWLECTDAIEMLSFVRCRISERKVRLFACGCARRVWHLLGDPRSRAAVEHGERFAEGIISSEALLASETAACEAYHTLWAGFRERIAGARGKLRKHVKAAMPELGAARVAVRAATPRQSAFFTIREWDSDIDDPHDAMAESLSESALEMVYKDQHDLLRCLFGNPFRSANIDSAWLVWNHGAVPHFARVIYDERGFDRLPILADALEESGCTDAAILSHLRAPGPHVRGCWALDLILGRE